MSMSRGLVCDRFGCLSWRSCGYYSLELRDEILIQGLIITLSVVRMRRNAMMRMVNCC